MSGWQSGGDRLRQWLMANWLDVQAYGGLALITVGAGWVYPPAAPLVAGAGFMFIALKA